MLLSICKSAFIYVYFRPGIPAYRLVENHVVESSVKKRAGSKRLVLLGIVIFCATCFVGYWLTRKPDLVQHADDMGVAFFEEDANSILSRCPEFTFDLYGTSRAKFTRLFEECLANGRKHVKSYKRRNGLTDSSGTSGLMEFDVTLHNGRTVLIAFYAEATEDEPYYKPTRLLFACWALEFFGSFTSEPPSHILAIDFGLQLYQRQMEEAGIMFVPSDSEPKQTLAQFRENIRQGATHDREMRQRSSLP